MPQRLAELFADPELARRLGQAGRAAVVARWSLERMVEGYEQLIAEVYRGKCRLSPTIQRRRPRIGRAVRATCCDVALNQRRMRRELWRKTGRQATNSQGPARGFAGRSLPGYYAAWPVAARRRLHGR